MSEFNRPFYFALPLGARKHHLGEAIANVADRFGVKGRTEFVRKDPGFYLFRVVSA